jgi:hypothetical protein
MHLVGRMAGSFFLGVGDGEGGRIGIEVGVEMRVEGRGIEGEDRGLDGGNNRGSTVFCTQSIRGLSPSSQGIPRIIR